jgi:MarC family membrane protein
MDGSFASLVIILLLVIDPLGNVPLFASLLAHVPHRRRARVILREWTIALVVLILALFFGQSIVRLFSVSNVSLTIAGGVILFLIALRMIFHDERGIFGDEPGAEPFIVPLAIPAIAGPTAIATVILVASREPVSRWVGLAALFVAMLATLVLLLFAEHMTKRLGPRVLIAMERLMGLILAAVAVEMVLGGIELFAQQLRAS